MGFFVVGSRTSRFGGSIFLPVTDIHAGQGKTVDGSKDHHSEGLTVTKTERCGQLQRQCWESRGQLQRQPQCGLRSVDGSKDNRLSVAMTTAMGT